MIQKGFTLLELIVVIVVAGLLGSIAIVSFDQVKNREKIEITKIEAIAHGKEALALAAFADRSFITDIDFRDVDLNKFLENSQLAASVADVDTVKGNYWLYTSIHNLNARIYSNGQVEMDGESSEPSPTPTPTPTPTPSPSLASTALITSVSCISSAVAVCDEDANSKAMYLNWSSTNQGSYKIEFSPTLLVAENNSPVISNNIFDTELYLGRAAINTTYTITLSVYPESGQSGVPAIDSITFTPRATTIISEGSTSSGEGTFTDPANNTTIDRSTNETNLSVNSANWQYIEITYNDQVRRIYKSNGVSNDNPLFKISNTKVNIALPSTQAISINVKYNGGSSGKIYILS